MSDRFSLAIDCSTTRGSIALGDPDGVIRWSTTLPAGRGHGGEFFARLQEALRQLPATDAAGASSSPVPLGEIIVGLGPGSYSGVRQAIAAAIGLAAATGARLTGAPSPLALETAAEGFHAVADARRGTYYLTSVEAGHCVFGPAVVEDLGSLRRVITEHAEWPILAVENVPPGLPHGTPVVWPAAGRLFAVPEAARIAPPLEPIYLRAPSVTLPRATGRAVPIATAEKP